jgi:hypothetical protein
MGNRSRRLSRSPGGATDSDRMPGCLALIVAAPLLPVALLLVAWGLALWYEEGPTLPPAALLCLALGAACLVAFVLLVAFAARVFWPARGGDG